MSAPTPEVPGSSRQPQGRDGRSSLPGAGTERGREATLSRRRRERSPRERGCESRECAGRAVQQVSARVPPAGAWSGKSCRGLCGSHPALLSPPAGSGVINKEVWPLRRRHPGRSRGTSREVPPRSGAERSGASAPQLLAGRSSQPG